jgi:hypothetical protein
VEENTIVSPVVGPKPAHIAKWDLEAGWRERVAGSGTTAYVKYPASILEPCAYGIVKLNYLQVRINNKNNKNNKNNNNNNNKIKKGAVRTER